MKMLTKEALKQKYIAAGEDEFWAERKAENDHYRLTKMLAAVGELSAECQKIFFQVFRQDDPTTWVEAEMYAHQSPPGTRFTDRAFNEGQRRKMENMSPLVAKKLHKAAQAAGIDTRGKYYVGGLGGAQDKAAWVTSSDDVLAVCKARNLQCDGVISHKANFEDRPPKRVKLAEDIVQRLETSYLAEDPGLAQKVKKSKKAKLALREKIIATHGARK